MVGGLGRRQDGGGVLMAAALSGGVCGGRRGQVGSVLLLLLFLSFSIFTPKGKRELGQRLPPRTRLRAGPRRCANAGVAFPVRAVLEPTALLGGLLRAGGMASGSFFSGPSKLCCSPVFGAVTLCVRDDEDGLGLEVMC